MMGMQTSSTTSLTSFHGSEMHLNNVVYLTSIQYSIKNVEDTSPQFPGFVRDTDTALHGKYVLYYTILPSLPVNKCCTKYIGFDPPEDRLFWRSDL